MNILSKLFRRRPKSDLGLTDNIALELLRTCLKAHCGEEVYLIQMRLWTSDHVVMGSEGRNCDLRTVKIEARPVAFSEPATSGFYDPDVLPRVEAEITFRSDQVLVHVWQFQMIELVIQRWGRRNAARKGYAACEVPELLQLSKQLFAYRNGNEIKRQTPAQSGRGPRFLNAPTS